MNRKPEKLNYRKIFRINTVASKSIYTPCGIQIFRPIAQKESYLKIYFNIDRNQIKSFCKMSSNVNFIAN